MVNVAHLKLCLFCIFSCMMLPNVSFVWDFWYIYLFFYYFMFEQLSRRISIFGRISIFRRFYLFEFFSHFAYFSYWCCQFILFALFDSFISLNSCLFSLSGPWDNCSHCRGLIGAFIYLLSLFLRLYYILTFWAL